MFRASGFTLLPSLPKLRATLKQTKTQKRAANNRGLYIYCNQQGAIAYTVTMTFMLMWGFSRLAQLHTVPVGCVRFMGSQSQ